MSKARKERSEPNTMSASRPSRPSPLSPLSPDSPRRPGLYAIRLRGRLEAHWSAWFDGLSLSEEGDDITLIQGPVADQAALHSLLRKVRDLGLPLLSVMQVDPDHATDFDDQTDIDHHPSNEGRDE